jgi:hypothetical protein
MKIRTFHASRSAFRQQFYLQLLWKTRETTTFLI